MKLIEEQVFTAKCIEENTFEIAQYEMCTFNNVDFKGISLSEVKLVECEFVDCDLSMVSITGSLLQDVKFTRCKMLGLLFETVKPFLFQVSFDQCNIENTSFAGINIENTNFNQCKMVGVDFSNSNLSQVVFNQCDMNRAIFQNTKLLKTDLRTAQNFSIDPRVNQLSKAIASANNLDGFLRNTGLDIQN